MFYGLMSGVFFLLAAGITVIVSAVIEPTDYIMIDRQMVGPAIRTFTMEHENGHGTRDMICAEAVTFAMYYEKRDWSEMRTVSDRYNMYQVELSEKSEGQTYSGIVCTFDYYINITFESILYGKVNFESNGNFDIVCGTFDKCPEDVAITYAHISLGLAALSAGIFMLGTLIHLVNYCCDRKKTQVHSLHTHDDVEVE